MFPETFLSVMIYGALGLLAAMLLLLPVLFVGEAIAGRLWK